MQGLMMGFEVLQPSSLAEAVALLDRHAPDARLLAGGTDLLILLRFGKIEPHYVIDLDGAAELKYLRFDPRHGLRIGAMANVTQVERSADVAAHYPALIEAAVELGSRQIRNSATVAGNICHSSPSAEFSPPLIALGAAAMLVGPGGERRVPLEEFFLGPGKNVLQRGEVLREIHVPPRTARSGTSYECLKIRKLMDIAAVNAAATIQLDASGAVCQDVRIALGAVAPVPFRATTAEDALRGRPVDAAALDEAVRRACDDARPIADVRATREYRQAMVEQMTRRVLQKALRRAAEGAI